MPSCSSLRNSLVDRELRIQGSYHCPPHPLTRPEGENPDATVVRCFQDSVTVAEKQLQWKRVYYASKNCQEDNLGYGQWIAEISGILPHGADATAVRYAKASQHALTRIDADWYYDGAGQCDLRPYPPGQTLGIAPGDHCQKLFPQPRKDEGALVFSSVGKDGATALGGRWGGEDFHCSR